MSKVIKKIAPIASIALPIAFPGLGTAIGAALGAGATAAPILGGAVLGGGLGAASGGGLKGAGLGAIGGGLAGGGGNLIAGKAGLTGAAQKAVGGALSGGVNAAASGGDVLTGAATGATLGGLSGRLAGSSTPSGQVVNGVPLPSTKPILQTQGIPTGGNPMRLGSLLSSGALGAAGDIYGMYQGQKDIDEIQDIYQQQAAAAQAQFDPYAQAGQTALANLQAPSQEALEQDPGYQFRLGQGQQAVERSLAARGLGQSGAALKAAQEYGQGLADQTYQDFFNRQSQIANQGFNAAQGLGQIYGGLGQQQANAVTQGINNRNQGLSNLFGGFGGGDDYLSGSLTNALSGLFGGGFSGQRDNDWFYNGNKIDWS